MRQNQISVVINTCNEEKNIARCLQSVKDFADEIVVVDMHSTDKTVELAKKHNAKVFQHEYTRFVEPARNFALEKASGDWILLLDADEELPEILAKKLKEIAEKDEVDYVEIPRKNIIFSKWIEHSRWWPDYLIRFFRRGKVRFSDKIHVPPKTEGRGIKLEATEENALVHYNFQSIAQFIERLNRYTDIQSEELLKQNYKFKPEDVIFKSSGEFLSRFFKGEGYKDGLHGLVLSLLQAFSEFVVYLKVWEGQGFEQTGISRFGQVAEKVIADFYYWQANTSGSSLKKIYFKLKRKIGIT